MMKSTSLYMAAAAIVCGAMFFTSCSNKVDTVKQEPITQGNPYLPLWEHIPDGEPYVFEDPDNPGKQRVYIYGSHDDLKTEYCGRDQVVWSAPVEDLTQWRYDGEILVVNKNAKGEPFDSAGTADVLYAPDVTLVTDSTAQLSGEAHFAAQVPLAGHRHREGGPPAGRKRPDLAAGFPGRRR